MASYNPMNNQGQFQYNANSAVENYLEQLLLKRRS